MKLAYALLADSAQYTLDGRLWVLGGDIDTLFVPSLPTTYPSLTMIFKVKLLPTEVASKYHVTLRFFDPEGAEFRAKAEFDFDIQQQQAMFPERENGIGIPVLLQGLTFEKSGEHRLQLLIGEVELTTLSLQIVVGLVAEQGKDPVPAYSE